MLAPGELFKMDKERLKQVAGDSEEVEALRDDIGRKLGILNVGLKETSRHVSRSMLYQYSTRTKELCKINSSAVAQQNASRSGPLNVDFNSWPSKPLFPSISDQMASLDLRRSVNDHWSSLGE